MPLILFRLFPICQAQNLIANPGFEVYDSCPHQFFFAPTYWQMIEGTPDYFNACDPGGYYSVPHNYFGDRYAHSGCGYEGIGCYDSNGSNIREFLQGKLDSTLVVGVKYFISFNMCLNNTYPYFWSGINKFGCKLSTNSFGMAVNDSSPSIDNTATFYTDSIVIDSANWVQINGSFVADSAYNFITFGCFFDDQHVQYTILHGPRIFTYYYFDDVCLSSDSNTCISVSYPCYTPNGVGEQSTEQGNMVFPNPFKDEINIKVNDYNSYIFTLYDVSGKKVILQQFNIATTINTAMLGKGLYFYEIKRGNKRVKTGKILKG